MAGAGRGFGPVPGVDTPPVYRPAGSGASPDRAERREGGGVPRIVPGRGERADRRRERASGEFRGAGGPSVPQKPGNPKDRRSRPHSCPRRPLRRGGGGSFRAPGGGDLAPGGRAEGIVRTRRLFLARTDPSGARGFPRGLRRGGAARPRDGGRSAEFGRQRTGKSFGTALRKGVRMASRRRGRRSFRMGVSRFFPAGAPRALPSAPRFPQGGSGRLGRVLPPRCGNLPKYRLFQE